MATNPLISVIIPVYNVEKYIEQCARSLMEQTMREGVEFLFIDDCTPDQSMEILNKVLSDYPERLGQVRILKNERNLGITHTRKRGIAKSRGEYIAWVDSDDWVDDIWLQSMYEATNDGLIDVVIQNVTRHVTNGDKLEISEKKLYSVDSPQQALVLFYTERHIPRGLPFQMSKRELTKAAIAKVSEVNYAEDTFTLLYLFYEAKSAVWTEKSFYHYRKMDDGKSLTQRRFQTKEEWLRQKINIDKLCKMLKSSSNGDYHITVNYIKWKWKVEFKSAFKNLHEYWHEYNEAYRDICIFTNIKGRTSIISTWLCANVYPLFRLRLKLKRGNAYYNSI